ncbi:MAG: PepSY-associated TM helix domain-containing protein [Gammaproteobacteria bacterium]
MSHAHHRKKRFKLKSFYIWHRYLGIASAFFLLILSVTGILLNHTESFQLNQKMISSQRILDWYGIKAAEVTAYPVNEQTIAMLDGQLFLDTQKLHGHYDKLLSAVAKDDLRLIITQPDILLITSTGEIVERLKSTTVALHQTSRAGIDSGGHIVIDTPAGLFSPDADFLQWNRWKDPSKEITWALASKPDKTYSQQLQKQYRSNILPLERVILDLHSGRIFGSIGPWVMDAAAVLLILLSLSGLWMWFKRRR